MYYPTFMFFGAGKFHDHDPVSGMVLGPRPTQHESAAKVRGDALRMDWSMRLTVNS